MFDESPSQPPSPAQALVALAPVELEWQPVYQASNQVVLYNPTSHALAIHSDATHRFPCPYCRRPLPSGFGLEEDIHIREGSYSRPSNYFKLLAMSSETTRTSSPPPLESGTSQSAFPTEAMAEGYFRKFFQEEYRLGMGAYGSVYLCQHVLDGNPLGRFAVKKIAVGESHSYLLSILREIRLLETLRHRNIITYHHAWLESSQFSSFGPKIPTLHVLMQWAEGGSLDDFIDVRLGRPSKLPHLQLSSSSSTPDSPSARIRQFRAMQRAPPEERERLRRKMEEKTASRNTGKSSWKAVHLLSAEEVRSLFSDVVEGLSFLHSRAILHLDLKPGNVLLTHDEGKLIPRAMLSDFGTSRDMLQSSGSRSGNTGTLEYASPESLPSPQTGLLKDVDSKSDMWSLGMILHKMLFFRLPYRYATEGERSEEGETDVTNKLEKEILGYSGFRSTPSLFAAFESRRLSRAFLILLETLLSITPSSRPSCERIASAIREGRFDPVSPAPDSSGTSLVPLRKPTNEAYAETSLERPVALVPALATGGQSNSEGTTVTEASPHLDEDEKIPLSQLHPHAFLDSRRLLYSWRVLTDVIQARQPHITKGAWIRAIKSCTLAAKAVSIVALWDTFHGRPGLLTVSVLVALADPFSERLQTSFILALVHLGLVWVARRVQFTTIGYPTY
ncbi:kinase-like protein [Pisolithus microcarpus]|nr:kinase-like protein [Pisolithus microcarpus]